MWEEFYKKKKLFCIYTHTCIHYVCVSYFLQLQKTDSRTKLFWEIWKFKACKILWQIWSKIMAPFFWSKKLENVRLGQWKYFYNSVYRLYWAYKSFFDTSNTVVLKDAWGKKKFKQFGLVIWWNWLKWVVKMLTPYSCV